MGAFRSENSALPSVKQVVANDNWLRGFLYRALSFTVHNRPAHQRGKPESGCASTECPAPGFLGPVITLLEDIRELDKIQSD